MKRWIERALNVHPGDLGRGTLLCSSLFLVISAYKIGGVASAALFLSRFQAKQLAYADISSAILVTLIVAGYVIVARRVHLRNLLVGSMLFFAANCAVFWVLAHRFSGLIWLFPAFYIWVKIFGVLAPTQIWTLANYVLTTREAKRVFGMVGGGGVAHAQAAAAPGRRWRGSPKASKANPPDASSGRRSSPWTGGTVWKSRRSASRVSRQ